MDRYDRGWSRPGFRGGMGRGGGYDRGMRSGGWGGGMQGRGGAWAAGPHGWDEYGRDFDRPMRGGWGTSPEAGFGRPRGGGWPERERGGPGRGYDRGYAREPFVPEAYYRDHPGMGGARGRERHEASLWDRRPSFDDFSEPDDSDVARAVRASLFQDTWLDAERIEVEVEAGIVRLSGEVDDFLEARYAWDDAWETDGVRGVINHITVRTDQPQEASSASPASASGSQAPAADPPAAPAARPARRSAREGEKK
jgi:hypothetical protein